MNPIEVEIGGWLAMEEFCAEHDQMLASMTDVERQVYAWEECIYDWLNECQMQGIAPTATFWN